MDNRWDETAAASLGDLGRLAYVSRLMGREHDLVLWGGGNTSLKADGRDAFGRSCRLLWMKPSGASLAAIQPRDFSALQLDDLRTLEDRTALHDAEMIRLATSALIDPEDARPSIETLLHAFLPDACVLHSHADALLALCNRADGEQAVRAALGDSVAMVGYRRPGFRLAMEVAATRRDHPDCHGIVLMKHGLVSFGETPEQAYARHIELVTRCEEAAPLPPLPEPAPADRDQAIALAPRMRGAAGPERILLGDFDEEVRAFVSDQGLLERSRRGPATADHLLATKRVPCIVGGVDEIRRYAEEYRRDAERRDREGLDVLDPAPRVLLVPGVGMWTTGKTIEDAAVAGEIYRHTMRILRRAGPSWSPIGVDEAFSAEYWPLQHLKRDEQPAGELAGRIAWISGAASGIGRAIARRFVEEGAHVLLADRDGEGVSAVAHELGVRAVSVECDVTREAQVVESFARICLAYGGLDIVVSNAGFAPTGAVEELDLETWQESFDVNATSHFLVAREALRIFRRQGLGGAIVFNASKNVPAPGVGFAAYSAAKAAETQLARVLALEAAPLGVRVNVLHPDAVFQDTRLWSKEMRADRAKAHGVGVDDLEKFYAARNLLKVPVRPEDVAEAALFFASARSSRTTGATLAVDGGVKEAFPR